MKQSIEGDLIRADADRIVMQEGPAVATYSRDYYRLPLEYGEAGKPILVAMTDPLPVDHQIHMGDGDDGFHVVSVLVPK